MTREQIVERLRDNRGHGHAGGCQGCYSMIMDDAADMIEEDARLLAMSQSEYERELEARLQTVTDRHDALLGLVGDAVTGVERALAGTVRGNRIDSPRHPSKGRHHEHACNDRRGIRASIQGGRVMGDLELETTAEERARWRELLTRDLSSINRLRELPRAEAVMLIDDIARLLTARQAPAEGMREACLKLRVPVIAGQGGDYTSGWISAVGHYQAAIRSLPLPEAQSTGGWLYRVKLLEELASNIASGAAEAFTDKGAFDGSDVKMFLEAAVADGIARFHREAPAVLSTTSPADTRQDEGGEK